MIDILTLITSAATLALVARLFRDEPRRRSKRINKKNQKIRKR